MEPSPGQGSWRRNLTVIWLTQFMTVVGFSFIFPFIPLFVVELGIEDPGRAALWSGVASGAMGLTMFVSGPLWGMAGDRYGRKRNLLRAIWGSAVIQGLTGLSTSAVHVVVFRLLTGVVSGTFGPAMALVASSVPRDKIGYAVGLLQSAAFIGLTFGPLMGGFVAQAMGFRNAFFITGGALAISGALIFFFVHEEFQRPVATPGRSHLAPLQGLWQMATSRELLPLLVMILMAQISLSMMFPVLPVLIKSMGGAGSAASATGITFAAIGVTSAFSSYSAAALSNRLGLKRLVILLCFGAGVAFLPLLVVESVGLVILSVALVGLFQGGLVTAVSALVGVSVSRERQGVAYGAFQSAVSLAFGLGPFIGGAIASGVSLRAVFLVDAIAFAVTALLAMRLIRAPARQEAEEAT